MTSVGDQRCDTAGSAVRSARHGAMHRSGETTRALLLLLLPRHRGEPRVELDGRPGGACDAAASPDGDR